MKKMKVSRIVRNGCTVVCIASCKNIILFSFAAPGWMYQQEQADAVTEQAQAALTSGHHVALAAQHNNLPGVGSHQAPVTNRELHAPAPARSRARPRALARGRSRGRASGSAQARSRAPAPGPVPLPAPSRSRARTPSSSGAKKRVNREVYFS